MKVQCTKCNVEFKENHIKDINFTGIITCPNEKCKERLNRNELIATARKKQMKEEKHEG